jgi:hypothetical protein
MERKHGVAVTTHDVLTHHLNSLGDIPRVGGLHHEYLRRAA